MLDSGQVDLVLLANGGELVLVEFKTGPQNPDFRECLAQLLDYGSDLWGMTLEDFEKRVAGAYFRGSHYPKTPLQPPPSLDEAVTQAWGPPDDDAVDWRERLQAQLRDGGFHYIAVAQRFTKSVLRTVEYLNATMKNARFSAVELVRFTGAGEDGQGFDAFEARFVAGAGPTSSSPGSAGAKTNLAGVDEFVQAITDDTYRHTIEDFLEDIAKIDYLTIYWGTTGCSLKVPISGRNPLSVGWIYPPGQTGWIDGPDRCNARLVRRSRQAFGFTVLCRERT